MSRVFRAYNVWPDFPSISISGEACSLDCRHCGGVYLKDMAQATTPNQLVTLCTRLKEEGARGVLLSGGCDRQGQMLNLEKMLPAVRKIHEMDLIIKLHTGFVDARMARKIAEAGVDIASMEMVGDSKTIKLIFGIDATAEDYLDTFINLWNAGIPHICPHVCVGLHEGKLKGETTALELLKTEIKPSTIAIIVLRPTKGTKLARIRPPAGEDVEKTVAYARKLFPKTKIILGALRPRGSELKGNLEKRLDIEIGALEGGIDGAEVPSKEMLAEVLSRGFKVKKIQAYGVLPVEYEDRVRSEF
jgi:hypothetical protein